ncbi:MAG: 2-C-methyl-D-erythritol 4-phosphate cytidylyltransferase, partial [Oscillibacter sp.]|nr:2-C-methyl-D-erythritol 4-phosphate cytidylyltransferase [Oscillibacter sp.]
MTTALIIAGGSGRRMGQEIPKQFLNVYDKPVLIYTLECFQRHPEIEVIEVVCLEGWSEVLRAYASQFGIGKLRWVISGGETAQESIRNGVFHLRDFCAPEDIVVIHDGIRPLVDDSVLSDLLVTCRRYGNAVTSLPYNEQIFVADDNISTVRYIPRDTLRRVATPQAYRFGKLLWAYEKAFAEEIGIQASTYANTLMTYLGERLYFARGS